MLIKNVDIFGERRDIRTDNDLIVEVADYIDGKADVEGKGRALIPGLHDHHIHLNASAAAMNSVRCGPPHVTSVDGLKTALNQKGEGWLRGIGYHHSVAGKIDREWLDQNGPDRPIRIQHRSGRMWICNSFAMDALEISEPKNGRLLDMDHLIRSKSRYPDIRPLIEKLLSFGITGVTEVTPSNGLAELEHYRANAGPLRLCIMGNAELSESDDPLIGPLKLHYHDHNLPALIDLKNEISAALDAGRSVAAHCVTRAELMLTLGAMEWAGPAPGNRIEHAAIADNAAIEWMQKLGVIVVTQPNFIAERTEAYLKDVPPDDQKNLWRLASFSRAGLKLAAGSDAPFGSFDPWGAMAAAVTRPEGFGANEALSPKEALGLYTKPFYDAGGAPRVIGPGSAADLCLLDRSWKTASEDLSLVGVTHTWISGRLVYNRVDKAPV